MLPVGRGIRPFAAVAHKPRLHCVRQYRSRVGFHLTLYVEVCRPGSIATLYLLRLQARLCPLRNICVVDLSSGVRRIDVA
jgi:hypothetical protein